MRVSELMSNQVISVTPESSATEAAQLFYRHNIGILPVCTSDGRLRGMVTDRDLVTRCVAAESDPQATSVREIMTRNVVSVSPEADVREAAKLMANQQIRRLPVVSGEHVVGMLSLGDVAQNDRYDMEAAKALTEITKQNKEF